MPQQLQVAETIDSRTVDTQVVRNVGIPSRLPPAERVVSVNARVEITEAVVRRGSVVLNGIIRATVFYASEEDPSNVVSIRRNFSFTDQITVSGAIPGYTADVEALISDIDFSLINNRLIGLEFIVTSDIEITAPETVRFIEERPGIEIRRQEYRIRRQLRERNFTRELSSTVRLGTEEPNIRRVVDVESNLQITDITTDYDQIIIRGVVNSDVLYVTTQGQVEFANLSFAFNESFTVRGVTPDMTPFVEINVTEENAELVDARRIRINVGANFNILVIREEVIEVPTEIIAPERVFPVRRTVLVERVVVEERTRIVESSQTVIPEGNPDIERIIRANGRIRGGSLTVEASDGGVIINGVIDINVIYVADLPQQPVYFTSTSMSFTSFINIPQVTSDMTAYADIDVNRVTADRNSARSIGLRAVMDVNLLVTERVRVPIITGISDQPVQEPVTEGFITYTVRSGDTLYLIAQQYGTTVNRLIQINNISDPGQLQVGQQILVPG